MSINHYQNLSHVGYYQTSNESTDILSSPEILNYISEKITHILSKLEIVENTIIVPTNRIAQVMDEVYTSFRPNVGSIYNRYHIPNDEPTNYIKKIIDETISIIVSDVSNHFEMEKANSKLSIWDTVLGDFNRHGLRSHPEIKLLNRRTNNRGQVSFMNY